MNPEFNEDTGTRTFNCIRNYRDPLRLRSLGLGVFSPGVRMPPEHPQPHNAAGRQDWSCRVFNWHVHSPEHACPLGCHLAARDRQWGSREHSPWNTWLLSDINV